MRAVRTRSTLPQRSDYIFPRYAMAFESRFGESLKKPKPALQLPHSKPRTRLVRWQWSTAKRVYACCRVAVHKCHTCPVAPQRVLGILLLLLPSHVPADVG